MTHKSGNTFILKWEAPYVVREVYANGSYKIIGAQGVRVGLINDKFLKRYILCEKNI